MKLVAPNAFSIGRGVVIKSPSSTPAAGQHLYASATDQLDWSSIYESGGNVGVNTDSPQRYLDVRCSAGEYVFRAGTGTGSAALEVEMDGSSQPRLWGGSAFRVTGSRGDSFISGGLLVKQYGAAGARPTGSMLGVQVTTTTDTGFAIRLADGQTGNSISVLDSADAEIMCVGPTGNVGVGESSPTDRLHLKDTSSDADVRVRVTNDARTYTAGVFGSSSDSFVIRDETAELNRFTIDSAGWAKVEPINAQLQIGASGIGSPSLFLREIEALTTYSGCLRSPGKFVIGGEAIAESTALVNLTTTTTANGVAVRQPSSGTGYAIQLLEYSTGTQLANLDTDGKLMLGSGTATGKLDVDDDVIRIRQSKTPSSSSDTGNAGEIAWDASYIYVCVASDTWARVAFGTWY